MWLNKEDLRWALAHLDRVSLPIITPERISAWRDTLALGLEFGLLTAEEGDKLLLDIGCVEQGPFQQPLSDPTITERVDSEAIEHCIHLFTAMLVLQSLLDDRIDQIEQAKTGG